jgi:hypothetical protein
MRRDRGQILDRTARLVGLVSAFVIVAVGPPPISRPRLDRYSYDLVADGAPTLSSSAAAASEAERTESVESRARGGGSLASFASVVAAEAEGLGLARVGR